MMKRRNAETLKRRNAEMMRRRRSDFDFSAFQLFSVFSAFQRFSFSSAIGVGLVLAASSTLEAGETYFNDEGVAFYAYETSGPRRLPLWRLLDAKKVHAFTSNDALKRRLMDNAGAVLEPSGIYLSEPRLQGMVALYEFKRKKDSRTILVVGKGGRDDLRARPQDFEEIPQKAWVFPPEIDPSKIETHPVPVRLLRNPFTDVRLYLVSGAEIEALLSKRQKRLDRLMNAARKSVKTARVLKVVAVGETGELGNLSWRFERSDNLGGEMDLGNDKTQKTRGEFISFDVIVLNRGSRAVRLRAPYILMGQGARLTPSKAATEAHVSLEMRFDANRKLGPGERKRYQSVYDLPPRAHDITMEVGSGDPKVTDVIILDTGR